MVWQRVLLGVSLAITLVLSYSLIWGEQGLTSYRNLKDQHVSHEARITELDERKIALSREIRLLQTDARYQEQVIRKRFNFVKDNEILYIFPGSRESATTGAGSQ